ncbi:hypothetical protein RHMOL_Rhmol03G0060700 [Rhododendron molle]|uniref:Uncharacterized protein n=2 Tax=Rhododendron molle TaxID=49168 RepID=A0ACC0PB30_RHOML|nr:hypothetical protein RHMOL_Rhmol03G0060200 [Rhododendron molle]KAI8562766.1 hypothetical protein RHMOL_Rhmol03G0060700 [Rhododendron molle]
MQVLVWCKCELCAGFCPIAKMAKEESSDPKSRWSLTGMTALVTGGTRGIGNVIAEELATLGATEYTCSRNEAELKCCLQEWAAKGFSISASVFDASSWPQREQLFDKVSSLSSIASSTYSQVPPSFIRSV